MLSLVVRLLRWLRGSPATAPKSGEETRRELDLRIEIAQLVIGLRQSEMATGEAYERPIFPVVLLVWMMLPVVGATLGYPTAEAPLVLAAYAVLIGLAIGLQQVRSTVTQMRIGAQEELALAIDRAEHGTSPSEARSWIRRGRIILDHRLSGSADRAEDALGRIEWRASRLARLVTLAAVLLELIGGALWLLSVYVIYTGISGGNPPNAGVFLALNAVVLIFSGHLLRTRGGYQKLPESVGRLRAAQRAYRDELQGYSPLEANDRLGDS